MKDIIVIGGCPGVGKTSAARCLGTLLDQSVVIHTDDFFSYLVDPVDPSTPAAKAQNQAVIAAYAHAALQFREGGYQVILEGVIGPWVFPVMAKAFNSFHYFLLHLPLETALKRVADRENQAVTLGKVERMYPLFAGEIEGHPNHVVHTQNISANDVANHLAEQVKLNGAMISLP